MANSNSGDQQDVVAMHAALQREKSRARAGLEAVSLFSVALAGGLLFWGGYYLSNFSGRFQADEFSEIPKAPGAVAAPVETPEQKVLKLGAQVYVNCAACHLDDGAGDPGKNIPPLAGSDWVKAEGSARLIRIVLNGASGPIKVNGQVWQGNQMNPWRKTADNPAGLSEEQIAAVLSYVRNSWGNKGSFVTVDEVKAVSEATKTRVDPWTEAELLAVPVSGGAAPAAVLDLAALKGHLEKLSPSDLKKLVESLPKQ